MCFLCGNGLPVCNLPGGCSVQTLDFIKMIAMTGGAGLGVALATISPVIKKKKNETRK